jgi:retron-type reverse transcriptase
MSLAALITSLRPLLQKPEQNFTKIIQLLDKNRDLAEYEVARAYAGKFLAGAVEARAQSRDPRERRAAVKAMPMMMSRAPAARILRRIVKDPHRGVRSGARSAVWKMGLNDVALPDSRIKPSAKKAGPMDVGGWNPTGWSFGLTDGSLGYMVRRARGNKPRAPHKISGLTPIQTEDELFKLLGIKGADALKPLLRPGEGRGSAYVEFDVPKATGGVRRISAPRVKLKKVQRTILDEILDKIPAHPAAHGFIKKRSVLTNAKPHAGNELVIKTDLQDFFPTVHYQRVEGLFREVGFGAEVSKHLAGLCTHRSKLPDGTVLWPGVLPQGAPTSPAIANLVCRRLDARLTGLAKKAGGTYTRYADDLTFSFKKMPKKDLGRLLWWIDQICQQEGFNENVSKRRVLRANTQQRVTGVVVNEEPHLPRKAKRTFRAILTNCERHGIASQARGRKDFAHYLLGYASYAQMVEPKLGAGWLKRVKALLANEPDAKPESKGKPKS